MKNGLIEIEINKAARDLPHLSPPHIITPNFVNNVNYYMSLIKLCSL